MPKNLIKLVICPLIISLSLICILRSPIEIQAIQSNLAAHEPGQALVKLKNSDKVYKLNTRGDELKDFIQTNQKNQNIEYVEPNYLYQASLEPLDTYYTQQVYLSSIQAPQAWNYTTGGKSVVIAVIDTGVDIDHPDLKNNLWRNFREIPNNNIDDDQNGYIDDYDGWDFVKNESDPRPKFGNGYSFLGMNHGTIVAGVMAAQGDNNLGVAGVTWQVKLMPLRVLDGEGVGNTLDVAKAINYAQENGADIINLSFVGEGKSKTLEQAITRAYQAGVLIVAAAGNEVTQGVDTGKDPKYPVCHDGGFGNNWVIGVASVDKNNHLASFSNYGKCIDIIAPGVGIFSTLFKVEGKAKYHREYGGYWSGTSVSAPQVAGVAALIKSLKPKLSLAEIRKLLLNNTNNIDSQNKLYINKLGHGKLNAYKVIRAAHATVAKAEYGIDKIIVGPGVSGGAHIRVYSENKLAAQFFGFDKDERFGANVASYDFDNDGQEEIVVAANKGEEPWIKIFDIYGNLQTKFLAFSTAMQKGIYVAVGDLNNDDLNEIIVVAQSDFVPKVKIFSSSGELQNEFYAFNQFFTGGLSLAVGDVNNDNFDEIVVGTGSGSSSFVKIFNYNGEIVSQFMAYEPNFMQGINVAVGDVDGDEQKEIIIGSRKGGRPQVKVFDWQGKTKLQFMAYDKKFTGGVNVAAGDINGDGFDEIITGAGPGGGPHVRVFNQSAQVISQFMAYDQRFRGGVYVASGK